jgi:hypothetical protein
MATSASAAEATRRLEEALNSGKVNEALTAIKQLKEIGVILTLDFIEQQAIEERKDVLGPSVEADRGFEAPRDSYVEAPRGSFVEAPRGSYVEAPEGSSEAPRGSYIEPRGSYVEVGRSSLELMRNPYSPMRPPISASSSYVAESSESFTYESIRSLKNLLISRGLDPTSALRKSRNVRSWEEYNEVLMQYP